MQLVVHAPFGARINKAWGLSLRKRFCVSFNFELQAAATDNGVNIALAEQHSFPLADVFNFLHENTVKEVLQQAALLSPLLETRWRWDANRSLALLRYWNGKKIPLQVQRTRSADLLASVFPDAAACQENVDGPIQVPDHPLLREVMKDIFHEALDLEGLKQVLRRIQSGELKCIAVDTPVPSVFSHEILNSNPYAYLDDAPLEERRARAVEMRRSLPEAVLNEVGGLDPAAIAEVSADAWPDVRDSDELADALQTLIALPEDFRDPGGRASAEVWLPFFERLQFSRRAARARVQDIWFWVSAEKAAAFRLIYADGSFEEQLPDVGVEAPTRVDALKAMITGWLAHLGPVTAAGLASFLRLPLADVEKTLLRIESSGLILRGYFTSKPIGQPATTNGTSLEGLEWCERRLLARIHRLTLGSLRKQIEPVTAATFMRWLMRWQHVAPGSQLREERGLLQILKQLQGFEIPASAWERQVFARRVSNYDPKLLDQLCLTGAVGWGRLSPHPAMLEDSAGGTRRVVPTSVAPITFFIREDAEWMALPSVHSAHEQAKHEIKGLSPSAREVMDFLRSLGASFFVDIVRGTGKLKAEVETGLWELVAAGLVTADGFDNLRALIDPKRRSGHGSGKTSRPRHSAGRWSLLSPLQGEDPQRAIESVCRMLLERYGVVFRELLARESILPRWRDLLIAFRRLEDRGEIRGGRFISGFIGEQFALPIAVESLRAMKGVQPNGEVITLSAADPLNLAGIVVPGERVPAISGKHVSFRDGILVETPEPQSLTLASRS
jgi:ATP-dependent Lhr-like helicase